MTDSIKRWLGIGGAVLFLATIAFLGWQNDALRSERDAAREDYGQEKAINSALRSAAQALVDQNARQNAALTKAGERQEYLTSRNTYLFRQLKETRNAKDSPDFTLGRVATDTLCLLWLANEERLPRDYPIPDPGQSLAGRDDPVARYCSAWPTLTAQGGLTWTERVIGKFGEFKVQIRAAREAQAGEGK